jgi:hypothetical protein
VTPQILLLNYFTTWNHLLNLQPIVFLINQAFASAVGVQPGLTLASLDITFAALTQSGLVNMSVKSVPTNTAKTHPQQLEVCFGSFGVSANGQL